MYNTKAVLNRSDYFTITYEDILERISEEDIYRHYVGDFKIGKVYNSPLRDDKNPSFGIFVDKKSGSLLYKDMATGQCGGVVKLVKEIKGLTTYRQALEEIVKDMNVWSISDKLQSRRKYKHVETKITISRKPFSYIDMNFWWQFGIGFETLKKFNVYATSKFFVNSIEKAKYTKELPIYAYKVFDKFKIYRPLSPKIDKWRGNLSLLDIQGFEQLPESGELLVITKSLKDVMTLYELGYNAIAPSSETADIPEIVVTNLKSRFKRITMFYDRDKTGMSFTRKAVAKYGFDFIFINKKHKTKDISDLVRNIGSPISSEIIKNLLAQSDHSQKDV